MRRYIIERAKWSGPVSIAWTGGAFYSDGHHITGLVLLGVGLMLAAWSAS